MPYYHITWGFHGIHFLLMSPKIDFTESNGLKLDHTFLCPVLFRSQLYTNRQLLVSLMFKLSSFACYRPSTQAAQCLNLQKEGHSSVYLQIRTMLYTAQCIVIMSMSSLPHLSILTSVVQRQRLSGKTSQQSYTQNYQSARVMLSSSPFE